jgi:chromosomal replication initiator protein
MGVFGLFGSRALIDMEITATQIKSAVLDRLALRHSAIHREWFPDLDFGQVEGGTLQVVSPDEDKLVYLADYCVDPFVDAAQAATGRLVSVQFMDPQGHAVAPRTRPEGELSFERDSSILRLNGNYVFKNFVVGPCNRLAQASCLAVSESPGVVYNPLFIHGNVGMGKTHLLHAICHRVLDRTPAARVLYLTVETFMNHYIEAMEKGSLHDFRNRYRHVDVLMIDDVQFLSESERTQDEFFHTFNALHGDKKQIVLSADCPPGDIPSLEDRLVSRFNWGLVLRIDPPCLETRLAIIKKKCRLQSIEMTEDVAMFLATKIKSNARELEGALNNLKNRAQLDGRAIDMALAKICLGENDPPVARQIRIQDIMSVITEKFAVKLSDLTGKCRSRSIVLPRQVCMYLARQFTQHSLEEIGGFFGGRDHTTVLYANKLINGRREKEIDFRVRLEDIENCLRQ